MGKQVIKVYNDQELKGVYPNVDGHDNLDGTLRLWGEDDMGYWFYTFKPGDWTRIEDISEEYVTKSGRVLTDADIQELADEAERGYDVSHLMGNDKDGA
jgi:hypothetical protein